MFPCQDTPSVKVTYTAEVRIALEIMLHLQTVRICFVQKAVSVTVVCLRPVLGIFTYIHHFLSSDFLICGKTAGCTVL